MNTFLPFTAAICCRRLLLCAISSAALLLESGGTLAQTTATPISTYQSASHSLDIPAQSLGEALILLGRQTRMQVTVNSKLVQGKNAVAIKGDMDLRAALDLLLAGSGLGYRIEGGMVHIQPATLSGMTSTGAASKVMTAAPILVTANAIATAASIPANRDLQRSADDAQPYVIIEREVIKQSGATSMEELLTRVLPMSTAPANRTARGWTGTSSQIDLRGLGSSHTLILINGRRGAGTGIRGSSEASDQQNINNMPLAAIERIEVLPASASAIYGSNAIGGVLNLVLRRDYTGTELNLRYGNTFESDQTSNTTNLVSGISLEDGRTHLLLSAQLQNQNALLTKDRPFAEQGRALVLRNNPDAFYGMNGSTAAVPPMGALVNIRSVNGSALFPSLSDASFTHIPKGYAGWQADGMQPLVNNLGTYNLELSNGIGEFSGLRDLVGEGHNNALGVGFSRYFSDDFSAFLDLGFDESEVQSAGNYHGYSEAIVPASAPNNPFGQAVYVSFPVNYSDGIAQQTRDYFSRSARGALGFNWQASSDWTITGDYAYSNSRIEVSYQRRPDAGTDAYIDALADGSLDVLRDVTTYTTDISRFWTRAPNYADQSMSDYALRASGSLLALAAGDAHLATGLEYRELDSEGRMEPQFINNPNLQATRHHQTTRAAYAELKLPLMAPVLDIGGIHMLELQLAARYEGVQLNSVGVGYSGILPTIGLSITPSEDWQLRASYSEGLLSPDVAQFTPPHLSTSAITLTDPLRGDEQVTIYPLVGGNPDLEPEQSKSRSFGVIYNPNADVRISVDYYQIRKDNGIANLSSQALVNDPRFSQRVTRAPAAEGDVYGVGQITGVYNGGINALWLDTRGFDTSLSYSLSQLTLNLSYTYVDRYLRQEVPGATPLSYLANDIAYNLARENATPLRHRLNTSAVLGLSPSWKLGWSMQYYGQYRLTNLNDIQNQGSDIIPSQIYHDLFAQYSLGQPGTQVDELQVTLGINNIFDDYQLDMANPDYLSRYATPLLRHYYLNLKTLF